PHRRKLSRRNRRARHLPMVFSSGRENRTLCRHDSMAVIKVFDLDQGLRVAPAAPFAGSHFAHDAPWDGYAA
ncbi:MAG TPA: hypothetical protein VEK55_09830, partial [Xanthobacteraceae bacterium]|nr:hypothetical protein [Xanthobacteraceae bacterium]